MNPLREKSPGDKITAADYNDIVQAVRSCRLSGPGVSVNTTGTTIDIPRAEVLFGSGGRGAAVPEYLSPLLTEKDGAPAWSVTPGYVNNEQPHTTGGIVGATDDSDDWAVPISGAGGIYVKVSGGANGSDFITPYKVIFSAATLPESDAMDIGYLRIGTVVSTLDPDGGAPSYSVTSLNRVNVSCANAGGEFFFFAYS
jgi:hypothetical protein